MSSDPRAPIPQTAPPSPASSVRGVEARLLAEAIRIHEDTAGPLDDAAPAEAVARDAGGNLERRILVRAEEVDRSLHMSAALAHVRNALGVVAGGLLVFAAIVGAAVPQAVTGPGGGNAVNFFVVLFAALGPETAALVLWLILAAVRSTRAAGLFGRVAAALGGRIALLAHHDRLHLAAARAVGAAMTGGAYGRWTLAAVTHAAWLVFLVALLAMMLFLLSTRSYVFVWETTILSAESYVPLTRWIAAAPAFFGFPAPGPDEVRASQWIGNGGQAGVARDAWAGLLVGSIVVYGIVPRLALLVACLFLRHRAGRRLRLDTARPGFARLAPRLMPVAQGLGYVDGSTGMEPSRRHVRDGDESERIQPDPAGPIAVLGLEIWSPATGWPPPVGTDAPLDLGRAQSRHDIALALDVMRRAAPRPRLLLLACALTTTPDRGLLAQMDAITDASAIPLGLVLTGGQRLRERASRDNAVQRIADWHALAEKAGIDKARVAEIDLDNLTDMSRAKLRTLAGGSGGPKETTRRLEDAFTLIRTEASRWRAPPDLETQAELHRAIAKLYQGDGGWRKMFDLRSLAAPDLPSRLRAGSDLLIGILPRRLALDPRWLTAGAFAGALGCIAAATLAGPAAIASLPLWAGLGAALTAAVRGALKTHGVAGEGPPELSDAVASAALFALVLDAQGKDETAITRMIDESIGDDTPALATGDDVADWLERIRRRYRTAEAREASRP